MNFSFKSIGHSLDHLGHFHLPRKISWSSLSAQEKEQLKTWLARTMVASVLALGTYLLITSTGTGTGIHVLAAMAGVSAFLYLALMFECTSRIRILLNLLAAPTIFFVSYVGISGSGMSLQSAFLLHAVVSLAQIRGREKERQIQLYGWAIFNICLALLI